MSVAQGSTIFNTQVIDTITAQVNAAQSCAELQALITSRMDSLIATKLGINDQIALLAPLVSLVTAPTNPAEVLTWITNFITGFLEPYILPYNNYSLQLIQFEAQVTTLVAAMTAKANSFEHCTVTIPVF
jgi:hypothetical protein